VRYRPGCPLCEEPRNFRGYHQVKAVPSRCGILPNLAMSASPITSTEPDRLGHRAGAIIEAIMRRIRSMVITNPTDTAITTASTKLPSRRPLSPGFPRTRPHRIPLLFLPLSILLRMDNPSPTYRIRNYSISLTMLLICPHPHRRLTRLRTPQIRALLKTRRPRRGYERRGSDGRTQARRRLLLDIKVIILRSSSSILNNLGVVLNFGSLRTRRR